MEADLKQIWTKIIKVYKMHVQQTQERNFIRNKTKNETARIFFPQDLPFGGFVDTWSLGPARLGSARGVGSARQAWLKARLGVGGRLRRRMGRRTSGWA